MINTLTESKPITHEEIAHYAYLLWEADGKPEGRDVDYWVKAETILYTSDEDSKKAVDAAVAKAKPRKKPAKAPKAKLEGTSKKTAVTPAKSAVKKEAAPKLATPKTAKATKAPKTKTPATKKKSAKRSSKKSSGSV